jgi:cyclopropane-fatty-acyl-phospholipid synthase
MYLAYCEAGFAERRIGLVQAVLAKPQWRRDELGLAATARAGARLPLRSAS